jgi:hypothetical protein
MSQPRCSPEAAACELFEFKVPANAPQGSPGVAIFDMPGDRAQQADDQPSNGSAAHRKHCDGTPGPALATFPTSAGKGGHSKAGALSTGAAATANVFNTPLSPMPTQVLEDQRTLDELAANLAPISTVCV